MPDKTIVVLYQEMAGYFLRCLETLVDEYRLDVLLITYPTKVEAPFKFNYSHPKIKHINRTEIDYMILCKLIDEKKPKALYFSGWLDKDYNKVAKKYFGSINTILGFDNKWEGTFKQNVAALLSPFVIKDKFNKCFVPGTLQKKFALKLGFKEANVQLRAYSADFQLFSNYYTACGNDKKKSFPKRFIYAGRYVGFKGVDKLWKAFIELQQDDPNDWELWCLGAGGLNPVKHPKIKHFGFVQPENFLEYARQTGVFVMPSLFEPWGVVLHEFAAMGFPILASDRVGATECFLEEGKNGYIFKAGDINSLKEKLKEVMQLSSEQLNLMGEYSAQLAQRITPKIWADNLMKLV
jgi:glycosyltransferase involved in cell wall biosynthesis